MAVKDFEKYYNDIEKQYFEMLVEAEDMNKAVAAGEIEEKQYNQALKYINTLKDNYQRLSYVMFLLKKRKKYLKACGKEQLDFKENKKALDGLKALKGD